MWSTAGPALISGALLAAVGPAHAASANLVSIQTPRGVRLAVRRLLAGPEYRRRAEALQAWAAANDGAAAAADAVEELGRRSRSVPQTSN